MQINTLFLFGSEPKLPIGDIFKVRGTKFDPILLNLVK